MSTPSRSLRRCLVLVAALLVPAALVTHAGPAAADGTPTAGFGTNGVVSLTPNDGGQVVTMPDGRLVVLGDGVIQRLNPNGTVDTTFGTNGRVVADNKVSSSGALQPGADRLAVLDSKRVLVHGDVASSVSWYVLREDGSRDPNFGVGGYVQAVSSLSRKIGAVVVRPDGDALAWPPEGLLANVSTVPLQGTRIDLASGASSIDSSWGEDVKHAVPDAFGVEDATVLPSGRIVVLVRRFAPAGVNTFPNGCSLVAFDPAGNIDHAFGSNGGVGVAAPTSVLLPDCAMATMADGTIVVAVTEALNVTKLHHYSASGAPLATNALPVPGEARRIIGLGDGRLVAAVRSGANSDTLKLRAFGLNDAEDVTFATGLSLPSGANLSVSTLAAMPSGGVLVSATTTVSAYLARVDTAAGAAAEPELTGTNRYVALPPQRILDTRVTLGAPRGPVNEGGVVDLQVAGAGGVPATGASAVVLNVTAADAAAAGFVTVWPTGAARPTASNLNLERAGQIAPNLVIVKLGSGGRVSMYTKSGVQLIADVAGYFEPAPASSAGRFVAETTPLRILDTRNDTGGHRGKLAPAETMQLAVSGVGEIPASGVSAVVVNITGTDATNAGYVTAWPAGGDRPDVSNVNLDGPGSTRPNLAIVRLGAGGKLQLFSQTGTNLVVDVTGWFTDATQPLATSGLFVPVAPQRLLDTRLGLGALGRDGAARLYVAGTNVVPPQSSSAVVFNLTATEAAAAGFVTAFPAALPVPTASNLNVERAAETIPNLVVVRSNGRAVDLFSQTGTHLVADLAGWFTS